MNRKNYKVGKNQKIEDVLNQMKKEGYTPIRRMEKPVFIDRDHGEVVVDHQEIVFVGQRTD